MSRAASRTTWYGGSPQRRSLAGSGAAVAPPSMAAGGAGDMGEPGAPGVAASPLACPEGTSESAALRVSTIDASAGAPGAFAAASIADPLALEGASSAEVSKSLPVEQALAPQSHRPSTITAILLSKGDPNVRGKERTRTIVLQFGDETARAGQVLHGAERERQGCVFSSNPTHPRRSVPPPLRRAVTLRARSDLLPPCPRRCTSRRRHTGPCAAPARAGRW